MTCPVTRLAWNANAAVGRAVTPGTVVLLNGTSSAGKTSTARALLAVMDPPCVHFDADSFDWDTPCPDPVPPSLLRGQYAYLSAARSVALSGTNVVLEYIFKAREPLVECARLFEGVRVCFIGLYCPLPELERRERERGDRRLGMAAEQFPLVSVPHVYDLELDTSRTAGPEERAAQIKAYVEIHPDPAAFSLLRRGGSR